MLTHAPNVRARQVIFAAAALSMLSVAATWPLASDPAHLSVVHPTDNDFRLNNYLIFWGAHALRTDPLSLHHTNMFHPERFTFAYGDMLLTQSVLMLPVIEAFYNPVLTYNLLLIAGLILGGTGFFVLARTVTGSPVAAFVGALVFAFNPLHFTRYQQIQLIGDHWLPWMAWALWRWLRPADEAVASPRWAAAAAAFFCLNALSGSHMAVFGILVAGLMIGWLAALGGRWRRPSFTRGAVAFLMISIVVLAPIFWPYLMLEERLAATRAETLDLPGASLRPLEALSARSRFYRWVADGWSWPAAALAPGREPRAHAFPGLIPLLLGLAGVFAAGVAPRRERGLWMVAAAVFVFLALGAYGGYALVGNLPLIRLIRVPTRFLLPASFALAMLSAYGAAALTARLPRRRVRVAALAALALLFAGEATFAPLRTWPYEQTPRPVNEFLAAQPGDFAVVEFPLDPFAVTINMRQLAHSIHHWKRLLVGYSGYQSPENIELLRRVRDTFPADRCLDELLELQVRYVVLLAERVDGDLIASVAAQRRLQPAWKHEGWLVYRVLGAGETNP